MGWLSGGRTNSRWLFKLVRPFKHPTVFAISFSNPILCVDLNISSIVLSTWINCSHAKDMRSFVRMIGKNRLVLHGEDHRDTDHCRDFSIFFLYRSDLYFQEFSKYFFMSISWNISYLIRFHNCKMLQSSHAMLLLAIIL